MNNLRIFTFLSVVVFLVACNSSVAVEENPNNGNNNGNNSEWLIPISEVRDGGPGRDGIPSIDNPVFVNSTSANFLNDDDLVIGIVNNDELKVYPHLILDWHEVVNDEIGGESIAISYCPLTGTAFGWKNQNSTFGVSGLLYNANLILYDRGTNSNWSQLNLQCVNGELIGNVPVAKGVIETNWRIMKKLHSNIKVLSLDTGFSRNYGVYPYGDYRTNHDKFIFPVNVLNSSLPNKERVYAIIDGGVSKVYRFGDFNSGLAIKDSFNGKTFLIIGNGEVFNSFELNGTLSSLTFEYVFNSRTESFFKDNEGNEWDVFGKSISGPRKDQTLTPAKSVVSYWFAIAAFYLNPEIF